VKEAVFEAESGDGKAERKKPAGVGSGSSRSGHTQKRGPKRRERVPSHYFCQKM